MLRSLAIAALAVVALSVASSVYADSARGRDCWCRYSSKAYLEGSCICMRTPAGLRRACCGRVLNNSSWSFTPQGCTLSDGGPESRDAGNLAQRGAEEGTAQPGRTPK